MSAVGEICSAIWVQKSQDKWQKNSQGKLQTELIFWNFLVVILMVGHRVTVRSHLAFLGSFTIERQNPKLFQKHIVINKIKWNLQEYLHRVSGIEDSVFTTQKISHGEG